MFTPRSSHISNARFTHSLLWPAAWQQAGAVKRTTSNGGFVIVRRFVVNSLLFTCIRAGVKCESANSARYKMRNFFSHFTPVSKQ